mgnify:CR=1 FL=1
MRELSLNILDIVTNSIEAESSRVILVIQEDHKKDSLTIRIRDNGRGMDEELVAKVRDPFVTTRKTRPVGMGISLLHQLALQSNGELDIWSELGTGTEISVRFRLHSFNRPPLGDIAGTLLNLMISTLDVHFVYIHTVNENRFSFDSYWLLARLAETDRSLYSMVEPAKKHINDHLKAMGTRA